MNAENAIKTAIIVAGGMGRRMQSPVPKQFLMLAGKPVIFHTIDKFLQFDASIKLIIALPEESMPTWETLCRQMNFTTPAHIARGGETRFHSVLSALAFAGNNELIAVHDAVRPLVSVETIKRTFEAAGNSGAAIPVLPPADSLRRVAPDGNYPVNRSEYVIVQTPQVFRSEILFEAYQQNYDPSFTDDASVVQKAGFPISLVEGNPENIKITSPADLKMAEFLLQNPKNNL
jgi:2-C-methyl-D-erythritol 4-phosphate cytidylyltransferase